MCITCLPAQMPSDLQNSSTHYSESSVIHKILNQSINKFNPLKLIFFAHGFKDISVDQLLSFFASNWQKFNVGAFQILGISP